MAVHAGSVTAAVQVVFVAAQAEFPAPGPGTDPGGTLVIVTIDRLSKEIGDGGAIAIDRAVGFVTVGAGKNAILLISPQIGVFQAAPVSRCRNRVFVFVQKTVTVFILQASAGGLHHSLNRPAARDRTMIVTCGVAVT
jgi:hypothetical protein